MPQLELTPDELLTTTRSVRKRLDFSRPVEAELLRECLEIAAQAPTGGNRQHWHFVMVTDPRQIALLGAVYQKGWALYLQEQTSIAAAAQSKRMTPERITEFKPTFYRALYLGENREHSLYPVNMCIGLDNCIYVTSFDGCSVARYAFS